MSSGISFTGYTGTGRTSSFQSRGLNFPLQFSLSDFKTYEDGDDTVKPHHSLGPGGCEKGDFAFGYDPQKDQLQFFYIKDTDAEDDPMKISDNIVFLGHLDPNENADQTAAKLLKLHYKMLGEPIFSEAAGSKEDQEAALEKEYLRLAAELKKAREVQLKEKATESANSQMGTTSGTGGHI